jgi:hypothetical protein
MRFYNLFYPQDTPNGSNSPAAGSSTHSSKHGGDTQLSRAALIAQKQAEITAKVAAMKNTAPSPLALSAPTPIRLSFPISTAISRPCPITASGPTPHTGSPAQSSPVTDDINRRVAEVRRRIAEAQSKLAFKDNPYMVSNPTRFLYHYAKCPHTMTSKHNGTFDSVDALGSRN